MRQYLAGILAAAVVTAAAPAATAATPTAARGSAPSPVSVGELRVNHLAEPLGIEVADPVLGWQLDADRRGVGQQAYEVHVATSAGALDDPDVWDSGKVTSARSVDVAYDGPDLTAGTEYAWSVRVWDDRGTASGWSEPARFGTGLGHEGWTGEWIGADTDGPGAEWTDYTIAFTASDISGALGVYFRGEDTEHAYMWQLSEADHALRPHVKNGGYSVLDPTGFPDGFDFAAEHDYEITVDGATITTRVDDEVLDQRTDTTFGGSGTMGFRTNGEERGLVHDLTVTSADGTSLVSSDFAGGDQTFVAGEVTDDGLDVSGDSEAWLRTDDSVPLLRTEVDLAEKEVVSARVYASARGVYELRLNGERVGDAELAPGWTAYDERIDYQAYDVTDQVRAGANVLGAEVAPGWYTGKVAMFGTDVYGTDTSVIAEMHVEYADGTTAVIGTDDTWRSTDGPTREADLLDGESYDARRAAEVEGWDEPGYDADGWSGVAVRDEPTDVLEPQTAVDVRVTEELETAEQIDSPTEGTYLYDLGQNMVGHVRLTLRGEPGQTVTVRHGEVLNPDGTLYTANLRTAKATDRYTFVSDEPETFEPSFTFHGFRYVEISGVDEAPDAEDLVGVVVGTDGDLTSELDTSSDLVDQLHSNIVWGMRGNFLSIPTDTPARDERMGWTGDINVFARTAVYNMDSQSFLTKWLQDLRDTQRPNGSLPGVAPVVPGRFDGGYESAGWMDAGVHVPWTLWQAYGDTDVIRENYDMMRRYVDFLEADSTDHIRSAGGYLDWLNLDDPTPADVLDTAFVAKSTRELAQMAAAIGRDGEAAELTQRYEAIRAAYQDAFIGGDGTVKGDSQTSYILTLTNDLAPEDERDAVVDQFVETLERRDYHLSTGFLGVDGLLPALTEAGRSDIAYRLLQNEDYPSWGYEIGKGATTVWERWNSINPDGSFNNVGMNSFNHYAYGAVGEWMYRTMAGVSAAEPGYEKVLVDPEPGDGIDQVDFSHETPYGTVRSAWDTSDGPMRLDLTIPANTTAEVRIPAPNQWAVTEGGTPIGDVDDVRYVEQADGDVVLEVGSGDYTFAVDRVLGDLGAARAQAAAFADAVDALEVRGLGKIARRHLALRTKLMRGEIGAAWRLHERGARDELTAAAVHRALASAADLDRWATTYADRGAIDEAAAESLRNALAGIERKLSRASSRLIGAVAGMEVTGEEILPGDVVRVRISLENAGKRPLTGVESTLEVPEGWSVEPVGRHRSTVKGSATQSHAYDVSVPAGAEASTAELTGEVSYRYVGGSARLPVSAALMVAPGVGIDDVSTTPDAVEGGESASVTTTLTNRTDVEQTGQVTLTVPEGWEAPAPVDYRLEPGGTTTVSADVAVPRTVADGQAAVTVATGPTDAEQATGTIRVDLPTPPEDPTDHVDLGDGASESDHGLTASEHSGINTEAGLTRRYTHSSYPGGWFEFDVAVPTDGAFVVRVVETFDGATRKTYEVRTDGEVVHEVDVSRSEGGAGARTHQFVVEPSAATADGTVRMRFQDVDGDYDPSVADVWVVPTD
ncbi:family 78 glycoside hydrolase catalytic domain [Nocardioides panacisoli]|uniref:family 78 glycoside hydrolase catalytic domain n=1 Tax=Nocardioides panacisoli TaxID=627624 RepID=UPI001C631170|nr:family 78 glycoside hydrolase catalytic domain [Nocardioides panacisoli]QYJ03014.1 family 78 glycoside hydrolase catalytic domain [Nocardioides panacisoli]